LVGRVLRPGPVFLRLLVAAAVAGGAAVPRTSAAVSEVPLASAVTAPKRAMTLTEALRYAHEHQPSLQSALARVSAAAADTRIARAQWLPTFGATAQALEGTTNNSTASYISVREVAIPRIGGTPVKSTGSFTPSTSTLVAVGAGQEIFDFGRVAAQAAVADVAYESERYHASAERLRVELLVKDAYFAVHGARAVLRAAEDAYARARVHRDMAAAAVKSGLHAPIELTRAEADLTRFEVGRIRASGGLDTARVVFAAAVGFEDRTLDAAGDPPPVSPTPALDDGLKLAIERDPTLQEARARLRGTEAITRAIAAELRPDLLLSATFSERGGAADPSSGPLSPDYGPLPVVPNWDVGLVLRWPIYDPVVAARQRAAAARIEVARADLAALSQQDTAAVQQGYAAVQIAQAALVGLQHAADAARANYAQAEARFKAGLGTSLELADAEAVRTDAEIQLAVGSYDVLRARALLARLFGEEEQ
jgi:outer membrane protein TolC